MIDLPTPKAAMRIAVGLAKGRGIAGEVTAIELDQARTWVIIAAELRAGQALPLLPLPDSADMAAEELEACDDVAPLPLPRRDDDTQVLADDALMHRAACMNCGYELQLLSSDLVHLHSKERSCPTPGPSGDRTYAE